MQHFSNRPDPNRVISNWYSWPSIVIFFFIFFPVGMALLYGRIKRVAGMGRGVAIFGAIMVLLFFSMLAKDTPPGQFLANVIIISLPGLIVVYWGIKSYKNNKRYEQLVELVDSGLTSLERIASAMGITREKVVSDFNEMRKMGYFNSVYIDSNRGEILSVNSESYQDDEINDPIIDEQAGHEDDIENEEAHEHTCCHHHEHESQREEVRLVRCPNCGGNNSIRTGAAAACEYCGSIIE